MAERKTTPSLAIEYILKNFGRLLHPREIAQGILAENAAHYEPKRIAYERKNKGRSVANQLEREIYALRYRIEDGDERIRVDISDGIRFTASPFQSDGIAKVPASPTASTVETLKEAAVAEILEAEEVRERDLYPNVVEFFLHAEGIVCKRISESRSSNRRGRLGNMWLHPDVVGMSVPGRLWAPVVRECSKLTPARKMKLISVEVKVRLTSSDVREAFFQTVSNSQWANRAYLAATEVVGEETWRELEMLCALHGVGYVRLDPDQPKAGRILIPAREREDVDWASANRIAVENGDFQSYLSAVLNYLQSGDVVDGLWDRVEAIA